MPDKFVVSIPRIDNYPHTACFQEVAESVHFALLALGHESHLVTGESPAALSHDFATEYRQIIFGAHLWPVECVPPPGSIIFNLERTDVPGHLEPLLDRCPQWGYPAIWDYSATNVAYWLRCNNYRATHVPIGYVPQLTRIRAEAEQHIDVLFYGSFHARRMEILDECSARGLNAHVVWGGPYGLQRDEYIARAKIVLNLHFYEPGPLEIVRVSYLMANRKCVITEPCDIDDDLKSGLFVAEAADIPRVCEEYVRNPAWRRNLGEAGFQAFSKRDFKETIRKALEATPRRPERGAHEVMQRVAKVAEKAMVEAYAGRGGNDSPDMRHINEGYGLHWAGAWSDNAGRRWWSCGRHPGNKIRQDAPCPGCEEDDSFKAGRLDMIASSKDVADAFHRHYYGAGKWTDLHWRGSLIKKNPFDLQMYQEIISECQPDIIVETGTEGGGSAVFFRDMLRLTSPVWAEIQVGVISVDIDPSKLDHKGNDGGIVFMQGADSAYPGTLASVEAHIKACGIDRPKVMVVLDSNHTEAHVAAELELYARLVTPGQYLVVEDTNINGHPVRPDFGPGPWEAVEKWLPKHPEFEIDLRRERLGITSNPRGWLKRKAASAQERRPREEKPTLCLVVCGSSHEKIAEFLTRNPTAIAEVDELVLLVTTDGRFGGLAAIGNRYILETQCDVLGLVHADTVFRPGALRTFAETADDGLICGLVGRSLDGRYVWSKDGGGDVSTLDGCSIFLQPCFKFDEETFPSWHCVVEDLCLQAEAGGLRVVVPSAQAEHLSDNWNTNHDEWMRQYWPYRQKLAEKWKHLRFETT
jgi:cephalosporin hydroxylase